MPSAHVWPELTERDYKKIINKQKLILKINSMTKHAFYYVNLFHHIDVIIIRNFAFYPIIFKVWGS